MLHKNLKVVASTLLLTASSIAFAANDINDQGDQFSQASSDGVLKFSGFIGLKCASPSTCGNYFSGWARAKVYEKFEVDIPPRLEMRLYWKQNTPAGIAAGRNTAKTLGAECPDGSRMTATWTLSSSGYPLSATAIDCDGQLHAYSVRQPF
ncbi:hypothetical protein [Pleionea sp. CnH1-48]|uniref:hypothetical protein n=1 Tax=Pleionea sp. CnH1-48 TaxID=2954494 RepID=UPI002096A316|nr:hypothetical protein [Pleionea sp. CnH1-48]MCO7225119.1 hypothetical protein [Pleionea sp. CnH1-48]